MPSTPPSRPRPDCLTPPNGAAGVGDHALVEADHPGLEALAHPERAVEVTGEDVGHQPVLGVVGGGDRLVLGAEARDRGHGPEDLLVQQPGAVGSRRSARSARRSSPGRPACSPPTSDLGALCRPRRRPARRPCRVLFVDQRADLDAVLGAAADLHLAHPRGQLLRELVGHRTRATWKRLAAVQASPMLRILAIIAPVDRVVEIGVLEHQERARCRPAPSRCAAPARRPARSAGGPPRWSR